MTTPSTTLDVNTLPDGLVLTGQFISAKQQNDRPSADGTRTYPGKYVVTLLNGDRTTQVEYRDERTFENMTGYAVQDLDAMERIALPVGVRAAKGYAFYFGRNV